MAAAFAVEAALALGALLAYGTGERGTLIGLQLTARVSFLLFAGAYTGAALTALAGPRFEPIKRRGRELGLAFASGHLAHVALVGWLCRIGPVPSRATFAIFGLALGFTLLLVVLSIGRVQRMLSRRAWSVVRSVSMGYIALAFALDFWRHPFSGGVRHVIEYLPFALLSIAAPLLVAAARVRPGARAARSRPS